MAYVTGTANTIASVTSAIISACASNGWTLTAADVISKGNCFIKLTTDAANSRVALRAGLGYSAGALVTPCALDCYLSALMSAEPLVFPITYSAHILNNEVYFFLNWGVDKFANISFGQSGLQGGPGTGVWISGAGFTATQGGGGDLRWITSGNDAGSFTGYYSASENHNASFGLFAQIYGGSGSFSHGTYVHHGLPGWSDDTLTNYATTSGICRQLNFLDNPSTNPTGQAVLVPIQPFIDRGSSLKSIVLDLLNARYVRLDTINPKDIITIGPDRWMAYPMYKRDTATRLGSTGSGATARHSGTYGYAIRYDGP